MAATIASKIYDVANRYIAGLVQTFILISYCLAQTCQSTQMY